MKTENNVMYILRLSITLLLITVIVGGLLAGVNSITKPIIDQLNAEKTQKAIAAVLPGGGEAVDFTDSTGLVTAAYKGENGYAIQVSPVGFNGPISMMVGVDFEGKVLGISVITHTETPSLGAVAAAKGSAGDAFRGQFAGLSGTLSVDKDGGQVDSISGATITSRAICVGVNAALECAANMG